MKKIKLKPLTLLEDLNINVRSSKTYTTEDPHKTKEILKKVQELIAKSKGKGIIFAKTMNEEPPAIVTNLQTKDGIIFQFPEPNPVHLYFQNACNHLKTSQDILAKLKATDSLQHETQYEIFLEFFNEASCGIMLLVTSVEAFVNQLIPEDYIYEVNANEKWLKHDVEWKPLRNKMKLIIPDITKTNFYDTNQNEYNKILEVQKLRDSLVHLKTESKRNKTFYEGLIKQLLDFDPSQYVDAIFAYLNSVDPDNIQEITDAK